ncbi:MAG TPA: FAD binding domain-containing protein [Gaiellaceae bacterium]|nr:FAD binding domain-containing protein [Gaiellaceae bacterium]
MKPAPFAYDAPGTLAEALALLAAEGEDVKPLAGGQSLVPLLNFRLARPDRLVDLNRVEELAYLRRDGDVLRIGALARTRALERSPDVAAGWPLLADAARLVGHPQIRARGTVCGSVAHADPAAELPAALAALDARFHVRSARGARTLSSRELFVSYFTTALEPDELLVEIEVPSLPPRTGAAFVEHARTHGDFALGGAAAVVSLDGSGLCEQARLALVAAGAVPLRAADAERLLAGSRPDARAVEAAADAAVRGLHLGGEDAWRRALLRETARQALERAAARSAA